MGTPDEAFRTAEAEDASLPDHAEEARDRRTILAGTGQNIIGLGVFVIASFGMNILIARAFGKGSPAFGQITLITQLAFVAGAATRFGMDMAAVRRVAIETGQGHQGRSRPIVRLAVSIAVVVSVVVAALALLAAGSIGDLLNVPSASVRAAAIALIFVAVAQVYLGGSRGLKIMRHTLYAYWIGQSVGWIVITLVAVGGDRQDGRGHRVGVRAVVGAGHRDRVVSWRHATRTFDAGPVGRAGETGALVRYGAPRAPAALLSQALFYTDLAVLAHYCRRTPRASASTRLRSAWRRPSCCSSPP